MPVEQSRRRSKFRQLFGAWAAGASLLLAPTTSAFAAEPAGLTLVDTQQVSLTLTGFDPEVARANGFEIRTAADGTRFSAPISSTRTEPLVSDSQIAPASTTGDVSTQGTSYGDCGTAYVRIFTPRGVATGFTIANGQGVWYRVWGVTVTAGSRSHDQNLSGGASSYSWSTAFTIPSYIGTKVYATARLNDNAYVLLNNGSFCDAGTPSDRKLIT